MEFAGGLRVDERDAEVLAVRERERRGLDVGADGDDGHVAFGEAGLLQDPRRGGVAKTFSEPQNVFEEDPELAERLYNVVREFKRPTLGRKRELKKEAK